MLKAIKLKLKEGTSFDLYFSDGKVKRYDILALSDKFPQLNALNDRELFLKGRLLGWSAVVWNDELDINYETVYEEGADVSDEYDDIEIVLLGFQIKEKRLEHNLTQQELADKIGIDQSDLSKVEKGTSNPTLKMIKRIVDGLDSQYSIKLN